MNSKKQLVSAMVGVVAGSATLLLSACASVNESETVKVEPPHFYQHWVNAYEEQTSDKMVFRPKGSQEFPVSRFRMEYVFNNDGSCQYKYFSPVDKHEMKSCVYTKVGNKVSVYNDSGRVVPDLSFTLSTSPTKDVMQFTKGIEASVPAKNQVATTVEK